MRFADAYADPDDAQLVREHYHWDATMWWARRWEVGVKFGPLTVDVYLWGWRPNLCVSVMGRWYFDTLWIG